MRNLILAGIICLTAAACQTPQQTAGTTTGVLAGAGVGGPVGAVVGGVVGATATAPGGPLSPGYCYVQRTGVANSYMTALASHSLGAAHRRCAKTGVGSSRRITAPRLQPPPSGRSFLRVALRSSTA